MTEAGPISTHDPYAVSRRSRRLLSWSFFAVLLVVIASLIPLPYVVLAPGPVANSLGKLDDKSIITINGAQSYPAEGELAFTTVRINGGPGNQVNVFDLIRAAILKDEEIAPRSLYYDDDASREQVSEFNQAAMTDSQEVAAAVALRRIGRTVPEKATVGALAEDSPAEGVLQPGDVLISVGGTAVETTSSVQAQVRAATAGKPVPMVIERAGARQNVSVPTREVDGTTIVGVILGRKFELPVSVTMSAGGIGGPSAGTMFALATYDLLTPGELTGGKLIAGTGTLSPEGEVGPIGGIRQKLSAASRAGSDWFLAPADNCAETVGFVPKGLKVVRIENFDQALTVVRDIAVNRQDRLQSCG